MKLVENWSQATYNMPAARDARSVSKSFPRPKAKICLGLWNLDTIYETSRTAQATKWSWKQLKRNWRTWARLRRWAIRDWIWLVNRWIDLLDDWQIHSFVHVSICFIYLIIHWMTNWPMEEINNLTSKTDLLADRQTDRQMERQTMHFLGHHEKGMHDHKLTCLHESDLFCEWHSYLTSW